MENYFEYKDWSERLYPYEEMARHTPKEIVIHHSETKGNSGITVVRRIQDYHINHNDWDEIGYHYLIDKDGNVYEGRDIKHVGVHCYPNTGKVGICLIGNFDKELVSSGAYASLIALLVSIVEIHSIDIRRLFGHRDFTNKSCPGKNLYELLPEIKQEVRNGLQR